MSGTGIAKIAGVTIYLMEELGDARLRCDQLLRYLDRATKLIEQSPQRDHFFEVAGDLIRSVPETAFKLQKALQAVALAADRLDYEEIKQDLRPEKVDELERVLKDVRIRHVQRRSEPMTLKPVNAPIDPQLSMQTLRALAAKTRATGSLPLGDTLQLIAKLEEGFARTASAEKLAGGFEELARLLANPPAGVEAPSRQRLAQVLRSMVAQSLSATDEEKQGRFEEGKPADPTKNMDADDAAKWKQNTEEHKDDFKKEARLVAPEKLTAQMQKAVKSILETRVIVRGLEEMVQELLTDPSGVLYTDNYNNPKVKALRDELSELDRALRAYDSIEHFMGRVLPSLKVKTASDEEKQGRFEEGKPADPTKNMDADDAAKWKQNTEEHKDDFKKEASQSDDSAFWKAVS